jgi:hypothetical protein
MRVRRLLAAVAVVLLLSGAFVGAGVAQSVSDGGSGYSLEDLRERGDQIEDKDPSSRYLGGTGTVYVAYDETNFIKELGSQSPEWAVDKVVTPGKTVDTNEVTLHVSRTRDAPTETVNVHVVTWERKTREVSEGNTTRSEPYAANVTETVHEVELSGGGDKATVDLPTAEDPEMVTMWVEEYPEARWVFPHHSTATSSRLPFGDTWGSFLPWFFTRFFGVLAIGIPVAIGGAIKTLNRTGSSPGKGAIWYVIVGGLVAYFAGYFALGWVAETIVSLPWVLGGLLVLLAYIATLEYADQTKRVLVEKLTTAEVSNPVGEEVPDIVSEEGDTYHVVEMDGMDGKLGLVKKGSLKHFLIVLAGADLPTIDKSALKTRMDYAPAFEEKFYVDGESDELLSITWPAWEVGLSTLKKTVEETTEFEPDGDAITDGGTASPMTVEREVWDRDAASSAFLGFAVSALVGTHFLGPILGVAAGFAVVIVMTGDLKDGHAEFVPAPAHTTPAKAARVTEQQQLVIAETFDELSEMLADMELDRHEDALGIAESYMEETRDRMDRLLGGGEQKTGFNPDRETSTETREGFADD